MAVRSKVTARLLWLREEYVGKTLGEWEVLEIYPQKGKKFKEALVHCSCGIIKRIRFDNLMNGVTKNCGHTKNKARVGKLYEMSGQYRKKITRKRGRKRAQRR